jgi:hypothetical protein
MGKVLGLIIGGTVYAMIVSAIASAIGFEPTYASALGFVAMVSWLSLS